MDVNTSQKRILSGMRPTGQLHLGHYHGVLKNWLKMQRQYECFFFVADWHALTTHYDDVEIIDQSVWDMVIDWLAVGIDPKESTLFIQSKVPEHAELHLLLSMITPLSWLERVPSYKDQQEKLKDKDLATYGFLGYPLLQSADILLYKTHRVPVGEDQVAHVELTREVARRFNHLYGKEPDFEARAEAVLKKLNPKTASLIQSLRKAYHEKGDRLNLEKGIAVIEEVQSITKSDKDRLSGYMEGTGKVILTEPHPILTDVPKMPGTDGQKMSKSYNNTIRLREEPESVEHKIRTMPTDPARVRRTDPGDPEKCPVWAFHKIYSDTDRKEWVKMGCTTAGIGCIDCKKPLIESVQSELAPIRERAKQFEQSPSLVKSTIQQSCERARDEAKKTLREVRQVMGLDYN